MVVITTRCSDVEGDELPRRQNIINISRLQSAVNQCIRKPRPQGVLRADVLLPNHWIGQSSSVIDDQKTKTATTLRSVNRVSKSAPLILPSVELQM